MKENPSIAIIQKVAAALLILILWSCEDSVSEEFEAVSLKDAESEVTPSIESEKFTDSHGVQCENTSFPNGEKYFICVPDNWNGELVVYAHGYVSIYEELDVPNDLEDVYPLLNEQGYAIATTSFKTTGLAVQSGIEDILELKDYFAENYGTPDVSYLTGASQGGIITNLLLERYPEEFDGGVSLCGPCGYFQRQIDHYANFRLLFEYYFPGIFPQDLKNNFGKIPMKIINNWEAVYEPKIISSLKANPSKVEKLLKVGKIPIDDVDASNLEKSIGEAIIGTLWYYFFTTTDIVNKTSGLPFDNTKKVFFGSGSFYEDYRINKRIIRVSGDKSALREIRENYETSGKMNVPLVMMHTTQDPIQLYWHQQLYTLKALANKRLNNVKRIEVDRFGHCNFTDEELLDAFADLVKSVKLKNTLAKSN